MIESGNRLSRDIGDPQFSIPINRFNGMSMLARQIGPVLRNHFQRISIGIIIVIELIWFNDWKCVFICFHLTDHIVFGIADKIHIRYLQMDKGVDIEIMIKETFLCISMSG
jgi:hypothetical protein